MNKLISQKNFDNLGLSFLADLNKLTECSIEDLTKKFHMISSFYVVFYLKYVIIYVLN